MRRIIIRIMIFILIIICQIKVNQWAFRSEYPWLAIVTLIGSVIILLYFPYKMFFNNKKQNKNE